MRLCVRLRARAAWGDAHNAFKELAKQVGEAGSDLLVVSLPIAKREYDPLNVNLAVSCASHAMSCHARQAPACRATWGGAR